MSLKITFANGASELRKLIEFLNYKDFFQDIDFFFKKESILIQSMDSSHVSLINVSLDKNIAQEYICKEDMTLSINLESLLKILKCCKDTSCTCIWVYNKGKESITIKFMKGIKIASKFQLKLISRENQQVNIPNTRYSCIQDINLAMFDNILSNLSSFGQDIFLKRTLDQLVISSDNSDFYLDENDIIFCNNVKDPVQTVVSLRYMQWITKLSSICKKVTLSFNQDSTPISLEIKDINMNIKCLIASKD